MSVNWEIHYDRRVAREFLARFAQRQPLHLLVEIARYAPFPTDLQFRHDVKTGRDHASLYVGLTDVLKVDVRKGNLRFSAHTTWSGTTTDTGAPTFGFREGWTTAVKDDQWSAVEDYLERVLPAATAKHATQEGSVQAAVSTFVPNHFVMLDREAALHFRDQPTKNRLMGSIVSPIVEALKDLPGVKGSPKTKFGGECDLLAVDAKGRVLAIEVKPRNVGSIRWAAAQATVYSKLFELWLGRSDTPTVPIEVLRGEWHQRSKLGLTAKLDNRLTTRPTVVPVVVVQRGTGPALLEQFRIVQERLCERGLGYPNLELYESGLTGRLRTPTP